ncbi:MAG: hypothetical protein ABGX23_00565 [Nautiliaceae bacterium]
MRWLIFVILLFLGCASKDVFTPKNAKPKELNSTTIYPKYLRDYTYKTLTFRELDLVYKKPTSFIDDGVWGEWVNYDLNNTKLGKFKKVDRDLAIYGDELKLIKENKVIKLPYLIATAFKRGDLIAILFEDNSVGVLKNGKMIAYKKGDEVIAGRYLKAKPIIADDVIVFPTLNSKIYFYIISANTFKPMDLSSYELIDNVIFVKYIASKDKLVIATPYKIAVLTSLSAEILNKYRIKHIVMMDEYIYIFTIDGRVFKYDLDLKKIRDVDLPFADYFAPGVCKGRIYTITSNGYLIKFDKDLNYEVYKTDQFDLAFPLRIRGCRIYNNDKVYEIE